MVLIPAAPFDTGTSHQEKAAYMLLRATIIVATLSTASIVDFQMAYSQTPTAIERPNANEWAAAAEILDRTAQLIEVRGFQQGALTPVYKECMATALEHAFQDSQLSIVSRLSAFNRGFQLCERSDQPSVGNSARA